MGHACHLHDPQAAARASIPQCRGGCRSMGLEREGSCPPLLGRQVPARSMLRPEPHAPRQHGAGRMLLRASMVRWWMGPSRNGVPQPILPPEKRVSSSTHSTRLQTASPPHYFFTARTILYLINNSQVQTITFAVMVREPHVPGEGEGAGWDRYC